MKKPLSSDSVVKRCWCGLETPLSHSYLFLALCNYYSPDITSAKVKEDRGTLRLSCRFKGTKKDIETVLRKNEVHEYYLVEIDKLIQKGPMAPPTFPV